MCWCLRVPARARISRSILTTCSRPDSLPRTTTVSLLRWDGRFLLLRRALPFVPLPLSLDPSLSVPIAFLVLVRELRLCHRIPLSITIPDLSAWIPTDLIGDPWVACS